MLTQERPLKLQAHLQMIHFAHYQYQSRYRQVPRQRVHRDLVRLDLAAALASLPFHQLRKV